MHFSPRPFAPLLSLGVVIALAAPASADTGGEWIPRASMNIARQETAADRIGDRVYVTGGLLANPTRATDTCEVYDIARNEWSMIAPMPEPRDHHAAAAVDGLLYVIGGYAGDFRAKNNLWVYDPSRDEWSVGPSLPEPRGAGWAVAFDGRIYYFGGMNFNRVAQTTTFIFDPGTNQWSRGRDMPTAREHTNAAAVGDFIYVIGGRAPGIGSVRANERYHPASDQWESRAPLPTARAAPALATFGQRIIVAGGETPRLFEITEVYETQTDTWTRQSDMPIPRHGLAAVTLDDGILMPAGGIIQGLLPTDAVDLFRPGPTLLTDGPCPGTLRFAAIGATPGGQVAFIYGSGRGNVAIPAPNPCAGTRLGLDASATLGRVVRADAAGSVVTTANVPAGACGRIIVQTLDVATCVPGNVAGL